MRVEREKKCRLLDSIKLNKVNKNDLFENVCLCIIKLHEHQQLTQIYFIYSQKINLLITFFVIINSETDIRHHLSNISQPNYN